GGGPAAKSHLKELTRLVGEAQSEAGKSFANMLDKLEKIKQVRAAQHLLKEKGAVLDIPSEMRTCLREGRYRDLVTLYNKASFRNRSRILQQVRTEAQVVARKACARLVETLRSADVPLAEQMQAMQRLGELDHAGEEPLGLCFGAQREHFLRNLEQCRETFLGLLLEAYSERDGYNNDGGRRRHRRPLATGAGVVGVAGGSGSGPLALFGVDGRSAAAALERDASDHGELTPVGRQHELIFFDDPRGAGGGLMDDSDSDAAESLHTGLEGDDRSDGGNSDQMDDADDVTMPCPPGVDAVTHSVFVARLQHTSNLAWCLSSWMPHLAALAVFLVRMGDPRDGSGGVGGIGSGGSSGYGGGGNGAETSPRKSIRLLMRPNAGGGRGDGDDSEWARHAEAGSVSDFRIILQVASYHDSDGGFRRATAVETRLGLLFREWLSKHISVLQRSIFGVDAAGKSGGGGPPSADGGGGGGIGSSSLAAANGTHGSGAAAHPTLAMALKRERHLRVPLPPRYLRRAFASLANLYERLSEAATDSWEGEALLLPSVRAIEQLVRDAQSLYVSAEMSSLATDAATLPPGENWLPPEAPDAAGGTRMPRHFGRLISQRVSELAALLPRAEWSGSEVAAGMDAALANLLAGFTTLSARAYEASRIKAPTGPGASAAMGVGAALASAAPPAVPAVGGIGDAQSPTRQLLCLIGNCLQLEETILPELWDVAGSNFGADKAGLQKQRERVKEVLNAVLTKYIKRKYRELKLYVRNGWYGYVKPAAGAAPSPGTGGAFNRQGSLDCTGDDGTGGGGGGHRRKISSSMEQQRVSLATRRTSHGRRTGRSSPRAAAAATASPLPPSDGDRRGGGGGGGGAPPLPPRGALRALASAAKRRRDAMTLPSYLVKVLLSLVQARLEAKETLGQLCYVRRGEGRRDILYADYVLRESARQVMEIVCDCANARVLGKDSMGSKKLDGSDPVEQAEKIAQVEMLRDALWRYLPSSTVERVERVIMRLQGGKWEGSGGAHRRGESGGGNAPDDATAGSGEHFDANPGGGGDRPAVMGKAEAATAAGKSKDAGSSKAAPCVSDTLAAAMPGQFLTASDLQELARVYVVCLR
ncbi:unnamed protein product, partial [Phaeothamnion confervicola]